MTNYERWQLLTRKLPSPQSYIDFGFYMMISIALQRRVWYYDQQQLFPNQYIVFVGPPAVGKGLVLGQMAKLLRFHKYEKGTPIATSVGPEFPSLFPLGADSITFEELMSAIVKCTRRITTPDRQPYAHCSYAFLLPELSSLFKKKTEDVCKFMLNAYDCEPYDYHTKHQGVHVLRQLCLNFVAATQPHFLKEAARHGIFDQGLSSRTLFLFESERRFDEFHIDSSRTPESVAAEGELLAWLKQLSTVYGKLTYNEETSEYLNHWYKNIHCPVENSAIGKLRDYLGRKKVIAMKLAAAIHFAEEISYEIPLTAIQTAISMLDKIEPAIAAGLNMTGRNELHTATRSILSYIKERKEVMKSELVIQFCVDLELTQLETCLKELELGYGLKSGLKNGKIIYKI